MHQLKELKQYQNLIIPSLEFCLHKRLNLLYNLFQLKQMKYYYINLDYSIHITLMFHYKNQLLNRHRNHYEYHPINSINYHNIIRQNLNHIHMCHFLKYINHESYIIHLLIINFLL